MLLALDNNSSPNAEDLLAAAERLLDKVLSTDCDSRSSALHLLTIDALITRSLEESAREPQFAAEFAERAMERIASHRTDTE